MAFDGLRERWERMAPRERKLMGALAAVLVVGILAAVAMNVRGGLKELEAKNEMSRDALRAMAAFRARPKTNTGPKITAQAVGLDSYLEGIFKELKIKTPDYPKPDVTTKGQFTELSMKIKVPEPVDVYQLKDLLERIETKNRLVIIKELTVDRNFREKEKLDVRMTVATYKTEKAAAPGGAQ